MKKEIKLITILAILLFGSIGYNSYQMHSLQAINIKVQKATVSTVLLMQQMMAPPPELETIQPGEKAPDFALKDINNQVVSLESLSKERKKIVVFSSAYCPYCEDYYPELDKFSKSNKDIDVVVIQAESTPESNKKFIEDNKYHFNILSSEHSVVQDYKISSTPTTVILDKNNTVLSASIAASQNDLNNLLGILE